jgi:hypothetical protein
MKNPASDKDPEYTNGPPTTRRPTLDDNMVYVSPNLYTYLTHHPLHPFL